MNNLQNHIHEYLHYCQYQKRLDHKTLKAYRIDLTQFMTLVKKENITDITTATLEDCIVSYHESYKPKTVKRKLASLKSFFHYLEYKDYMEKNPFSKIKTSFREPTTLPKTIPLHTMETLLSTMYKQRSLAKSIYQKRNVLKDIAVIEVLFATGMRVSELCSLKNEDVNLYDRTILIFGKGSKERQIQIGNDDVIKILKEYRNDYITEIENSSYFFVNQTGSPLNDQAVRRIIKKYAALASIPLHMTPHMFRHTFATCLLEADVDIRYIQKMLGHSSIHITEIYTHVTMSKQLDILMTKHPRKDMEV